MSYFNDLKKQLRFKFNLHIWHVRASGYREVTSGCHPAVILHPVHSRLCQSVVLLLTLVLAGVLSEVKTVEIHTNTTERSATVT